MDRGGWWAAVPGVTESQTQLSDKHFHFTSLCNPPIHPKSSADYLKYLIQCAAAAAKSLQFCPTL